MFTPASSRPEDVLLTGSRLLAFVDEQTGVALPPEVTAALAELRSTLEAARAKRAEARAALIEVQTLSQEARDAASAFHESLIVLRKVARNVLGRSHLDYQALRYGRAGTDEEPVEIIDDATESEPERDRESGEFAAVKSEAS